MNFFAELKRRNVFRVGAAYLVVGWLLTQVVGTVAPILALPEWFPRVVLVVIAVGFPIALLLAWAYELTPEGVKKTEAVETGASVTALTGRKLDFVIIGALVLALGYFVWERETGTPGPAAPGQVSREATIAVLPFVNMSSDPEQEFFSDGISEEILNVLAGIRGLRVTSRSSAFALKGKALSVPEMASRLGVRYVLEGSVRKASGRIRVTAQLIEVESDSHLWSETYDRDLKDVFRVQEEIAASIARELRLNLAPQTGEAAQTKNMEAYELFLRGRGQWIERTPEQIFGGIANLEAALEIDPAFSRARANLAMAYLIADSWTNIDEDLAASKARQHALRAVTEDPDLAEAWLALSSDEAGSADPTTRYRLILRAYELDPQNSLVLTWKALHEGRVGFIAKAFESSAQARAIDPLVGHIVGWNGQFAAMMGNDDIAEEAVEAAHALGWHGGDHALFLVRWKQGRYDEAVDALIARWTFGDLESSAEDKESVDKVRSFWGWVRDRELGRDVGPMPEPFPPEYALPFIGTEDTIRRYLEDQGMSVIGLTSIWAGDANGTRLRGSAAFRAWARATGLVEFWKEFGWPDMCRPVESGAEEDDFECD